MCHKVLIAAADMTTSAEGFVFSQLHDENRQQEDGGDNQGHTTALAALLALAPPPTHVPLLASGLGLLARLLLARLLLARRLLARRFLAGFGDTLILFSHSAQTKVAFVRVVAAAVTNG